MASSPHERAEWAIIEIFASMWFKQDTEEQRDANYQMANAILHKAGLSEILATLTNEVLDEEEKEHDSSN